MGRYVGKAPTPVLVCATLIVLALIGASTALALAGKDQTSVRDTVQTILTAISVLTGGGALLYAGSAAKSSHQSAEQTNGVLYDKMRAAVRAEMAAVAGDGESQLAITQTADASATKGR